MSSKRKAEQGPLTTCPITGLTIDDHLSKKLKMSSTVTKKTLQNTLTNKLGWRAEKIQDSWTRDELIQEYYTALEMQKTIAPVCSPSAARPSPAKAAPVVAKGGAREQTRSTRGRTSSSAPAGTPMTASPPERFGGSPELSRSALPGSGGARAKSPAGRGSDGRGRSAVAIVPHAKRRGVGCLGVTLRLFLIFSAAVFVVIYLVHGFEGGKQKLIEGAKGNYVENFQGFAASTWKSFLALASAKLSALWDFLTTLTSKLTMPKVDEAVPKDGLVATPPKTAEKPAASKPVVTLAKEEPAKPQENAAEQAKKFEEARKAAEEEEKMRKQEEQRKEAEDKKRKEEEQRKAEQKRKDEEQKRKEEEQKRKEEEERNAEEKRKEEEKLKAEKRRKEEEQRKENLRKQQEAAEAEAKKAKELQEKQEQERRRKELQELEAKKAAEQQEKQQQQKTAAEPSQADVAKVRAQSCVDGTFDVYQCDMDYPDLFTQCREKKAECEAQ